MAHRAKTKPLALAGLLGLLAAACTGDPVPAAIEATVEPARTWYHTGQEIQLTGRVTDADGAPIEDVQVAWTVEPAGAATVVEPPLPDPRAARFVLSTEGRATFTGCVVPTDEDLEPTLCDSLDVRIDDGTPSLEVTTPAPGAELSGPEGIVVEGSVADRSMVNVYVNGTAAEVDEMGRFEASVEATFGVNHLIVSASDGLTDVSDVEMDVLWAPTYTPALGDDGTPELRLDDGLTLWLGQDFFDDGVPLDPSAEPIVTRDLADILELVVSRADLGGLLPDPVVDEPPNFVLRVTDPVLAEPTAELDLTDGGAELFIRLGRIEADTSGVIMVEGTSLPLTGSVSGTAVAFAELTVRKEDEDAELEVSLGDLSVGLESLDGTFESSETQAVFWLAEGLLRTTLEEALVDAVRGTLEDSVPVVLRDALGAIDTALADQELALDSEPFPPVTIQIDGRIAELRSRYRNSMTARLRTTMGTDVASVHPDSPGVARLEPEASPARFYGDGSLKLGVRLALLNGLLHSLWNSGLLDVDATPLLPESVAGLVSEARLLGRLPPVLRPAREDEPHDLVLTVGQLELELMFMGEPVRYAVSLEAGVDVTLADNHLAVEVAEEPVVSVWTLQPPSNPRLLTPDTVRTLLTDLWPDLRDGLAGSLAFDLPIPSLGDLGGIAPDLSDLTLALDLNQPMRPRRGVLVLDAALTGELP
ncbi:MAG TPA: hypothetical protein RMH99_15685 [Sandaracinaceae bacterium LLY-WYZ-13_1]|nr:hypothetical protein [Sandaracinaceae bacterium LLY-WYZ-13_1]